MNLDDERIQVSTSPYAADAPFYVIVAGNGEANGRGHSRAVFFKTETEAAAYLEANG